MTDIRLVHGFTHYHGLGGVQSMLAEHHAGDRAHGLESSFLAYFEPRDSDAPRVTGLGLTWRHSIRAARSRFARERSSAVDVVAYHNCWGLPFFAGRDQGERRLGVLHTDFPGLRACLRRLGGLLDGLLCVSQPLLDLAQHELPDLRGERLAWLPYPIAGGELEASQRPLVGRPLVVGFAGRLSFAQKRVDRFPDLVRRLDEMKLAFRLEFLGTGPQEPWLRRQFRGEPRVLFHGRQLGEAYRTIVRRWDSVIYVSDYEGLPITLLEALAAGVIPVYPQIGSGGDRYVSQVRPDLLYPAGVTNDAAMAIRALAGLTDVELAALRRSCLQLARPHTGDCYLGTFAEFTQRLTALPRVSFATLPPRRRYVSDWIPFGALRRLWPIRLWQPNRLSHPRRERGGQEQDGSRTRRPE